MRLGAKTRDLTLASDGGPFANRRARVLLLTASSLTLALAAAAPIRVHAEDAPAPKAKAGESAEIVVNGIPYRETVLPTRLKSESVYGLDLNVMDTPRNTTLLSTTQLETLNIKDPRAFSYLTASSYTGSAFGTPNIPQIRGYYADVYINGMRSSFTQNGYGAPYDFDSIENISITKGPASVIDGPGAGVGGSADLLTKRPNLNHDSVGGSASIDSIGNRRLNVDVGGPILPGELGFRISYSGEDSDSYFYGHYMHKNAVYGALRWQPNDKYQLDFNSELNVEQYTENVGVNRVNQALINHDQYLQGAPDGVEYYSSFILGATTPPYLQIGSAGNPYSPVTPILTEVLLTGAVPLNTKITIDQTPGTSSRAVKYNAQVIQHYYFSNNVSLENNTFFDYQDSDNYENYYYSDSSRGSWTLENRTDLNGKFTLKLGGVEIANDAVAGVSYRFAHTNYISDFSAETMSVYDLTSNPKLWVYSGAYQEAFADAFSYKSPFGKTLYGVPGRDVVGGSNTGISDLHDGAVFFQDRMEFTPQLSALFGARLDAVQNHTYDPLGGAVCTYCFTSLPQEHSTGVFGLGNGNVSLVYKLRPWVSTYATFNFTQSNFNNGGEGGVNTYGAIPDSKLLREDSFLYEAGAKFNLLNNKLFIGTAVFDQKRAVPAGAAGTVIDHANVRGIEIEANYQPTRNLFATASYSYIKSTLSKPEGFYNYPAQLGTNIDGAGLFAVYRTGQTFEEPDIPQHIFNFLGNYKFNNGIGLRTGVQVTGPMDTTQSGWLNLAASSFVPNNIVANGGYYKSPVIPWQYTWNAAIFYEFGKNTATLSVYNLTDRLNWQPAPYLYGNDMLVRNDPRTVEFRLQRKF